MAATADVACPKCGGEMWDNRENKRNPKAPDMRCKDKACEGCVWPPRNGQPARTGATASANKVAFSTGPHIPAIDGPTKPQTDGTPALPHEKVDMICAASTTFLNHVLKTEVPLLAKAEIGASDDYVHSRVANLLITAEKAGLFR